MANLETSFENDLRDRFREYLKNLPRTKNKKVIYSLFQKLKKLELDLYLFGGFPKDIYFKKYKAIPRDIDLVVLQNNLNGLLDEFKDYRIEKSRFGGIKIKYEGIDVDIWPLAKTWAFENGNIPLSNVDSLSKTTFLNIESIAIELYPKENTRKIVTDGFLDATKEKVLELNLQDNPFPELNIARALYSAKRLKYTFGPKLMEFISASLKRHDEDEILQIYERKYGITEREKQVYKKMLKSLKRNQTTTLKDYNTFINFKNQQFNLFDKT
ncbi:MAG: hypothetical protein AAF600_07195 [Bacteroidota bacterium]